MRGKLTICQDVIERSLAAVRKAIGASLEAFPTLYGAGAIGIGDQMAVEIVDILDRAWRADWRRDGERSELIEAIVFVCRPWAAKIGHRRDAVRLVVDINVAVDRLGVGLDIVGAVIDPAPCC